MSVYIERTIQRSSTQSPTFEKISLTSVPLWPNFRKVNGEGNAAPVRRSVFSVMGIGLPAYLDSDGFGSNVSTCRHAAVHDQVQDALGLGRQRRLLRRERIDSLGGSAPPPDIRCRRASM